MRPPKSRNAEQGFSVMELMVAMLITLIVSGAIYGLIASGQSAFRREPELADRQQNIRIAMDLIQRDVLLAGQGVPWFGQAFTRDDDQVNAVDACPAATGLNGCGLTPGTLGAVAAAARASGAGDTEAPDILEMISSEEQCPFYTVCSPGIGTDIHTSGPVLVRERFDADPLACMQNPGLILALTNYNFAMLTATVSAAGDCGSGGNNHLFTTTGAPLGTWIPFGAPVDPLQATGALGGGAWITQARIARYEIAPDPLDGAPSLWRSTTGLFAVDGTSPGHAASGAGTWQLVARGIEDMQVEYLNGVGGGATWQNQPAAVGGAVTCAQAKPTPAICPAEALNITRQVRVTLSARSMAVNIVGAVRDGNQAVGTEALRGQLQAVITPRAAKVALAIP